MKVFKPKNSEILIGSWVTIGSPAVAEIMAGCNFNWLAIDLEHSSISLAMAENMIRVIELNGVAPLVRLSSNNYVQIKRVMDAGAHGIIVPMIKTEADVKAAIDAVKYPPEGSRSVGLARAQGFGNNFERYWKWQRDHAVVVAQIEHEDAVKNINEIFSVKGLNGYILGPYDLSASLGVPGDFDSGIYKSAVDRIEDAAKDHDVPGGVHIIEPDEKALLNCIKSGNKFIAYSIDFKMIDKTCRDALAKIEAR